jgi:hypothetical protein
MKRPESVRSLGSTGRASLSWSAIIRVRPSALLLALLLLARSRGYLCSVYAWFSRVRGNPASFAWWCAHAVALLVLFLITGARGPWFWIVGAALVASSYTGQVVLNRRASR